MTTKFSDVVDAAIPAAFVATIAGTCFAGADYIALLSAEHFMEVRGWLASDWDATHATTIYGAVALMTMIVAGIIAWRMYAMARAARLEQDRRT